MSRLKSVVLLRMLVTTSSRVKFEAVAMGIWGVTPCTCWAHAVLTNVANGWRVTCTKINVGAVVTAEYG
jgi:hypothetical protein